MSNTAKVIGQRITTALEYRGMTAAELSRKTGIDEGALSNYRSGKYAPRQDRIYLISQALDVTPSWLMGFDTDPAAAEGAVTELFEKLPKEQQGQVLDYMRFLLNNQK